MDRSVALGEENEPSEQNYVPGSVEDKGRQRGMWALTLHKNMIESVRLKWRQLEVVQDNLRDILLKLKMEEKDALRVERDDMELDLISTGLLNEVLRLNRDLWKLKQEYTQSFLVMDRTAAGEYRAEERPLEVLEVETGPFVKEKEREIEAVEAGWYRGVPVELLSDRLEELFAAYPAEARRAGFKPERFFVEVDAFRQEDGIHCAGVAGYREDGAPCEHLMPFSFTVALSGGKYRVDEFNRAEEWSGLELEGAVPQFIYALFPNCFFVLTKDTGNPDTEDSRIQNRALHLFHENEQKNCSQIEVADGTSIFM